MRPTLTFLFLLFTISSFSQANDTLKTQSDNTSAVASFVTKFDIANATKDGFYLNGYVVNINYEKARKLNGKKIRVTGKVTIVKGIKNFPGEEVQGREEDTKHIESPKVEIIKG
jgi:hypothetical protein